MVFYYKNSFLASVFSIFGSGLLLIGILMMLEKEIGSGIAMILLSVPLFFLGKRISNSKSFKKWWVQIQKANLEPHIRDSYSFALQVWQKYPERRTLEKLRKLNPAAARAIEQDLPKKDLSWYL